MMSTKYQQLSLLEKRRMIGELQHAIMCSDQIFKWAEELIEAAKYAGIIKNEIIDATVDIPKPLFTGSDYEICNR